MRQWLSSRYFVRRIVRIPPAGLPAAGLVMFTTSLALIPATYVVVPILPEPDTINAAPLLWVIPAGGGLVASLVSMSARTRYALRARWFAEQEE